MRIWRRTDFHLDKTCWDETGTPIKSTQRLGVRSFWRNAARSALAVGIAAVCAFLPAGVALAGSSYFDNALVPRYRWATHSSYDATGGAIRVTLDYPAHGTDVRAVGCNSNDVIGSKGTFPQNKQRTRTLARANQVNEWRCFKLQFASRTLARYTVDGGVHGVKVN